MSNSEIDKSSQTENPKTVLLKPCAGIQDLDIPTGHVYKALKPNQWSQRNDLGWMTKEEAVERYGVENIVTVNSSTLCDSCRFFILSRVK